MTRLSHQQAETFWRDRWLRVEEAFGAAAALPLAPNPVPNMHAGTMVRGTVPGRVRCVDYEMELPEHPTGTLFFVQ